MEQGRGRFRKIFWITLITFVVALALVTTIILNAKQNEYNSLKDKNDRIPEISTSAENF